MPTRLPPKPYSGGGGNPPRPRPRYISIFFLSPVTRLRLRNKKIINRHHRVLVPSCEGDQNTTFYFFVLYETVSGEVAYPN